MRIWIEAHRADRDRRRALHLASEVLRGVDYAGLYGYLQKIPTNKGLSMHLSLAAIAVSILTAFATGVSAQTDVEALLTQGNNRGATGCATCHQADGAGQAQAGFPRLAGMDSDYFMHQLQAFKAGTRSNPVMAPIAKALSEEEGRTLAEYYEQQEALAGAASDVAPAMLAVGERLAQSGDWQGRELPACVQCHGPNGEGVGSAFPSLAGQHASGGFKDQVQKEQHHAALFALGL
jgi:cytochrome c553